MAWVGIVEGRILPVVWFEGSVNSDVYLEQVFKKFYVEFGEELGNKTSILVPTGWRQLPRDGRMSPLSA